MKLIGYLNAAVASRQVLEEYMPPKLPYPAEQWSAVRDRYGFQTFPDLTPGAPMPPTILFSGGRFGAGDDAFGIGNMIMEQHGDVVQAVTTDQAEQVLDDLASFLSERFEFRLTEWPPRRSYTSNLVVEFDDVIERYVDKLEAITAAMNRAKNGTSEIALKRIAFGGPTVMVIDQVSAVENAEFLIEKRVSDPMEPRRYYCSAPLQTKAHLQLLSEIEQILIG
jgi:hypothetical protein